MNWVHQSLPRHADGTVVSPQPSMGQRLYDFLFGRKALQAAGGQTPAPPPMPQGDISIVRKAAEEAGAREAARKAAQQQQSGKQ